MNIPQRLDALRGQMASREMDAYIVTTDDFHASEYVGEHFKAREYLSGFTGSAGTLVVLRDSAALWTDSRYFLQAADQLEGSGVELMRMGEPATPSMGAFLHDVLPEGARIGYDGRTVTCRLARALMAATAPKAMTYHGGEDLAGLVWPDRPPMSEKPVWEVPVEVCGRTRAQKLADIRAAMAAEKVDLLVIPALDEVAWVTNLRGDDVACTPVFLSYLLVEAEKATLFASPRAFSEEIAAALASDGIGLRPYTEMETSLREAAEGRAVWADETSASQRIMDCLAGAARIVGKSSPVKHMKAVKTEAEQAGMIEAHLRDGVAVSKFIYWLQHAVASQRVTELDAAAKILEFRSEQPGFLGASFESIVGYASHGAIVHYAPTPQTDRVLESRGLCLADTGGHYDCGTTDITRTIPLGPLTDEERAAYTLVLKGHLNMGAAVFPHGVSGQNLDCLAHMPLWERGLDYGHGTGHGVGHILCVHEGPHSLRWKCRGKEEPVALEDGMVVSNEPGYYLEGKFGIRHENLVLCKEDRVTEHGRFMRFVNLTMVPFDTSALNLSLMNETDVERLNAYHAEVWTRLEPFFEGEERAWLEKACAPVGK